MAMDEDIKPKKKRLQIQQRKKRMSPTKRKTKKKEWQESFQGNKYINFIK